MLLAAGGSSRMGRPKQLLSFQGKTLIRRAAETAITCGRAPIVVVLGSNPEQLAPELDGLDLTVAINPRWEIGMGSSIRCGLSAMLEKSPDVEAAIVTLCDQPLVTAGDLQNLIAAFRDQRVEICASKFGDSFGPPCLFSRTMFEKLRGIDERAGAKSLIKGNVAWVECERAKIDVDTLDDFQNLHQATWSL